jgi:hypothetical protein
MIDPGGDLTIQRSTGYPFLTIVSMTLFGGPLLIQFDKMKVFTPNHLASSVFQPYLSGFISINLARLAKLFSLFESSFIFFLTQLSNGVIYVQQIRKHEHRYENLSSLQPPRTILPEESAGRSIRLFILHARASSHDQRRNYQSIYEGDRGESERSHLCSGLFRAQESSGSTPMQNHKERPRF